MRATTTRADRLQGELQAPGDKSISHRALILAALAEGTAHLRHLAPGADVRSTAACLQALGVPITFEGDGARVRGVGLRGLHAPSQVLDCGNSGTTMRLLAGLLAGSGVGGVLDGDESLRGRPMRRVLDPLLRMGAEARGTPGPKGDAFAPLHFTAGRALKGLEHVLPIASAQVKSCVLLAGLYAEGPTRVREPSPSRDHTERMFGALGLPLSVEEDGAITLTPPVPSFHLPAELRIPGDPSSAAFALGAAALVPGSAMTVRGVDVNPTRSGFLRALARMGVDLKVESAGEAAGDPLADLTLHGEAKLQPLQVSPDEVPSLVDEIPLLAVLATQADGQSTFRGAGELRVKESDRLARMAQGLTAMGARVRELPDGLIIDGPTPLHGSTIDAARDHRIAMSFAVAGLVAKGETHIDGAEWADISFPGFFDALAAWAR